VRTYDTPENRLLKLALSVIHTDVSSLCKLLSPGAAIQTFFTLNNNALKWLKHPGLVSVPQISIPSHQMIVRARNNANPLYRLALQLLKRRMAIRNGIQFNRVQLLLDMVRVGWLRPLSDDDIFEAYVLARVMSSIEYDLSFGKPVEYGLVLPSRKFIAKYNAKYNNSEVTIKIYFDQSPITLSSYSELSHYMDISEAYFINLLPRRPDVLVEIISHDYSRILLIEAKNTKNIDYISESVYKIFGYLHDFERIWDSAQQIRALLVLPTALPSKLSMASTPHLPILSADDQHGIASAIRSVIPHT
jgi:hypothetical protein